jgi:hypothetical protein
MYHQEHASTFFQNAATICATVFLLSACANQHGGGSISANLIGGGSSLDWDYYSGATSYTNNCLDDDAAFSCQ